MHATDPARQEAQQPRKRGRPSGAEREQRRDDILDAAVRLFSAEGYERVTLDTVAAEARVTKRTIYAYFGDRSDVFLAAVERLRDRTLRSPAPDDDLLELAGMIVHTLHSDEAVGLHRLMIAEAHRFPELARRFYADGPQAYTAALAARLPHPDDARAEALFALLLGEAHRRRLLGLSAAPDRQAAQEHAGAALAALGLSAPNGKDRG